MKFFWQFIGQAYLLYAAKRKMIKSIFIFMLLIVNLAFLILVFNKINLLTKKIEAENNSFNASINRVYSQIYNINTRLPFIDKTNTR